MLLKLLDNYFNISKNNSTLKTEIYASFITFFSMIYIAFVNPIILQPAGLNPVWVFIATCLTVAISSILMGIYAKLPLALAPGMGLNALFTYTIVLNFGYTWQQGLAIIFIAGAIILIFSIVLNKSVVNNLIPPGLKHAITAGIGLFIIIIALNNSKIIVSHPATLVHLGNISSIMSIAIFLVFLLVVYGNIKNYFYIPIFSLIILSIVAYLFKYSSYNNIININDINNYSFSLNFKGLLHASVITALVTVVFASFFDSLGVLNTYSYFSNSNINYKKPLQVLGISALIAGLIGTSSPAIFLENNNGVKAGGRTGLVAIIVGLLFLITIVATPLISFIPVWVATPLLLLLGISMLLNLQYINWQNPTDYIPAFFILFFIPFSYSIATGIAMGFIIYTTLKIINKEYKDITKTTLILTILFIFSLTI